MKKLILFIFIFSFFAHLEAKISSFEKMKEAAFKAVLNSDERALEELIKKGLNLPKVINHRGENLLHVASKNGELKIIKILIEYKLNINAKDKFGKTPLHKAAENKHARLLKPLYQSGADVNAQDNEGNTPGMSSFLNGHTHIADLLSFLEGANLDLENEKGESMRSLIQEKGSFLTRWALKRLENANSDADKNKEKSATKDPYVKFFHAAADGDLETLKKFTGDINHKSKDYQGRTLAHIAAEIDDLDILKYLIEKKANFNIKDNFKETPLHDASTWGHFEYAQILIKNGADIFAKNKDDNTALHKAAYWGHPELVELLIESGDESLIKAKNKWGESPIEVAPGGEERLRLNPDERNGKENHTKVKQILIKHDRSITDQYKRFRNKILKTKNEDLLNKQDSYGQSPLHVFARKGDLKALKTAIENGADPNIQDEWRQTALHIASENADPEIVKALIEANADVNIKTQEGNTALMISIINKHFAVFKILLKSPGLNTSLLNHKGENAYRLLLLQKANRPKELKLLTDTITQKIIEAKKTARAKLNALKRSKVKVKGK